ncbi:MAG: hypothetical protein JKY98_03215 [Gammaproteobacteria bacterium]|nr:hypothetical protein [Gammaproteobacteria bacterium]
MKSKLLSKLLVIVAVSSLSQFALADSASATKEIAGILATFNHFPSDSDKAALMAIAKDSDNGRGLQAIASAITNMQHKATDADMEILNTIAMADMAPDSVKALAKIVVGISHVPSDEAKATLQAML